MIHDFGEENEKAGSRGGCELSYAATQADTSWVRASRLLASIVPSSLEVVGHQGGLVLPRFWWTLFMG
ncbi:UNVERIFIED_CONTAM: hypothetical protein Sradi_4367600 [Sesamum radiatum]|uniref:Uncharacterized protein n=1 Tax=Sesamum radiatum TaxID=300843 RepID=A0AAW2NQ67_SESRA